MKKITLFSIVALAVISSSNLFSSNIIITSDNNLSATPPDTIMHLSDSLKGDFNGDGKLDTLFVHGNDCLDEGNPDSCFCVLSFSNKLPSIKITKTMGTVSLYNLGDLNEDGSDEFGYIHYWHGMWKTYYVLTLKNGVWVNLVDPFLVFLVEMMDNGLVPIEKDKNKKGYVLVRTCVMSDDPETKIITKSIKVN